jgi:hypothetical protein
VTWQARALIFSGRPDPTWELSPDDEQEFLEVWSQIPPARAVEATTPAPLGYRGVEIVADDGRKWVATRGHLTLTVNGQTTTHLDPARTIERLVLATAPAGLLPPGAGPPTP